MSLQFICPACKRVLHIKAEYLGKTGRCNHCSERIALIGDAGESGPQMATLAVAVLEDERQQPASDELRARLLSLGVPQDRVDKMDLAEARICLELEERRQRNALTVTDKQFNYLKRLGARESQILALRSRDEASKLIEDLHVSPTPNQIHFLRELGATGADMARLRTKAEAAAFIEDLQRKLNV